MRARSGLKPSVPALGSFTFGLIWASLLVPDLLSPFCGERRVTIANPEASTVTIEIAAEIAAEMVAEIAVETADEIADEIAPERASRLAVAWAWAGRGRERRGACPTRATNMKRKHGHHNVA